MITNLKTTNITLIPTTFRSTEMFENVGIFVPKRMLINTCLLVPPIQRAPQLARVTLIPDCNLPGSLSGLA